MNTGKHFDIHFGELTAEKQVAQREEETLCIAAVRRYLEESRNYYQIGQDEYYARLSLEEGLRAFEEGNYAIGAIAVVVNNGEIFEYRARNSMGSNRHLTGHAESTALLDWEADWRRPPAERRPSQRYPHELNEYTSRLPQGMTLYGTLEPCPMCSVMVMHARAIRSISTVADGKLVEADGVMVSDGSAVSIGEKAKVQPLLWQRIQQTLGLEFVLLQTEDEALKRLSEDIWRHSLEKVARARYQSKH